MTLVTLTEFQRITGLSDQALLWLLKDNQLECSIDEENGLMIDIESTNTTELIKAVALKHEQVLERHKRIVSERFARIISEQMEEIARDVIARIESSS